MRSSYLKLDIEEKLKLAMTAKRILNSNKGILAADERALSLEARFSNNSIENSEINRRRFRELLFKTPNIEEYIGGAILNEETFTQVDDQGKPLHKNLAEKNIQIGIKLDKGLKPMKSGESVTAGLSDLETRIKDVKFKDCVFSKWRALFTINENLPSSRCIKKNIKRLCKFALISQKNGLVPIVEPEIHLEGEYDIERMSQVARIIYSRLYSKLNKYGIYIEGTILKISFIVPASRSSEEIDLVSIGTANIAVLYDSIPSAVAGIVFLSGGHTSKESMQYLETVQKSITNKPLNLSFSFGRALTDKVLSIWKGDDENIIRAQLELLDTASSCHAANIADQ